MIPNISKHFQRYHNKINEGFLEGVGSYSKTLPTRNPSRYPSAYHYISSILETIKKSIHEQNVGSYVTYMELHQKAIIALFENYVDNFLSEYVELWGADKRLCMDFITEKGIHWYKFSKYPFRYNNEILVVPRHNQFNNEEDLIVVDADEIQLLQKRAKGLDKAIELKAQYYRNSGEKIVSFQDNEVFILPLSEINTKGVIHDWSAPLFKD